MKKVLLVLSMFWVASAIAEDSWLYWMVGDTGDSYTLGSDYNKVMVRDVTKGDSGYLTLYYDSSSQVPNGTYVDNTSGDITAMSYGAGLYALLASDYTYSSFVIELWNDSSFVAQSGELSMSNGLADYIVKNNSMTLPTAWVGSSYAIPEPNSAMLLLLGCAALGLRRRRQLKA